MIPTRTQVLEAFTLVLMLALAFLGEPAFSQQLPDDAVCSDLMLQKPSQLTIEERQRVITWLRKRGELSVAADKDRRFYDMMLVKFDDLETIEMLAKSGELKARSGLMAEGGSLDGIRLLEPILFKVEALKFGEGDTNVGNSSSHVMAMKMIVTLRNAEKAPRQVRDWARTFDQSTLPDEERAILEPVHMRELMKRWFNTNRAAITERRWNDLVPGEPMPSPKKQAKPAELEPEREVKRVELRPMQSENHASNLPSADETGSFEKSEQKSLSGDWFGIIGLGIAITAFALLVKSFFGGKGGKGVIAPR